ncbi:MAG: hypothetical protein RI580_05075, partial [Halothece sp. Uz-M2-17]|nr:hypothetical protein [Halothece sp. Uz-M2-17]
IALLQGIKQKNGDQILSRCRQLMDRGREPIIVLENLAGFYRDLLIAKTAPNQSELVALTTSTWEQLCEIAQQWEIHEILTGQKHLQNSETQIKQTTQPRLWLEVTLLGLLSAEQPPAAPATNSHVVTHQPATTQPAAPKRETIPPSPQRETPVSPPESKPPVEPSNTPSPSPAEAETPATPAPVVAGNEAKIWQQVLAQLSIPSQALFEQHCHLVAIEGNIAQVGVKNQKLLGLAKQKRRQHDLEQALRRVLQQEVTVNLQVTGEATIVSPPQEKPVPSSPPVEDKPETPPPPVEKKEIPPPETKEETPAPDNNRNPSPSVVESETEKTVEENPATVSLDDATDAKELEKIAKELANAFKGEVVDFDQKDFSFLTDVNPNGEENANKEQPSSESD